MKEIKENKEKKKVAIIGVASITGDRLMNILRKHPKTEVVLVTSEYFADKKYKNTKLFFSSLKSADFTDIEIVFSCLPHSESMKVLPNLIDKDKLVIDLSADFRTPYKVFEDWYKEEHKAPELTPAIYGLSEVFTDEIKTSKFIANPGCYPTSVLLALAPLLNEKINLKQTTIFSISGRSGAGRKKAKKYEDDKENVIQYKPIGHQHIGEMEYIGSKISGHPFEVLSFYPHVATDIFQGMITTVTAHCDISSEEEMVKMYKDYYVNQPFIKWQKIDETTEISIKDVVDKNDYNNSCLLGLRYDKEKKVISVVSVIDNLIKGACGQAVQNMNLALGFDQMLGLKED